MPNSCRLVSSLALAPFLFVACSSSPSAGNAGPLGADPSDATAPPVDAAPPPVPEPPWSGQTIEPGCSANGCIHAFAEKSKYTKPLLAVNAAAGNSVANGVVEYLITYVSDGAEIAGSVFVPTRRRPRADGASSS